MIVETNNNTISIKRVNFKEEEEDVEATTQQLIDQSQQTSPMLNATDVIGVGQQILADFNGEDEDGRQQPVENEEELVRASTQEEDRPQRARRRPAWMSDYEVGRRAVELHMVAVDKVAVDMVAVHKVAVDMMAVHKVAVHAVVVQMPGPPRSTNVRGKTVGKGVEKLIAHNYGQKLVVQVLPEWNSLCSINDSKATSLLGVYLRMMCPIKNTPTWRHVDPATQSAVIQAVLDKCKISDDYHGNPIAQQAVHSKCYHMHINWRHRMKCHYDDILKQQLDPYNHPYDEMSLENWRHMIDDVWKSEKFEKRSNAGKINRGFLDDGHRSGSRSFVAEMTIPVENGGSKDKDFPEVYEKIHMNKDKKWISPICSGKHVHRDVTSASRMHSVRCADDSGGDVYTGAWEEEEVHIGFGVGPKPSSCSLTPNAVSRARDEELVNLKVDMDKMWMEREEEKREREAEMEKTRIEHEEEKEHVKQKWSRSERSARRKKEHVKLRWSRSGWSARRRRGSVRRRRESAKWREKNKHMVHLSIMVVSTL
ncbi:hypothetical protein Vadar_020696 [Vaccinium darrowii]|uniref:Uncharacterized protein n=1 Tax=Vaccinium darrowii TaxID=229202 RepID=A0ACB7XK04_9ERIC|nr:hypothetical protein Vadar_020696 [Vaccinium darrowii]